MSELEGVIGNWIKIIDYKNEITIEDYGYETGIIEGTTEKHCVKCVAVNKCLFKDENGNKPKHEGFADIDLFEIISKGLWLGLYHFKCHCKEIPAEISGPNTIDLIIPEGKIDYLFRSKKDWINAMGYKENDYINFVNILLSKTKEAYFYGKYYIENITKYGCKINLLIDIPGKNEKQGKNYKIITNYMIFPNGKLKMNTPIGGWQK